ncbi:Pectin methylesterase, partial [Phytophthora megakarya]
YINGAIDFIFGSKAQAWFESCDIETVGRGCITANGRTNSSNPSYFVFNNARVFGSSGNGSAYLGRPWRPYARVVWQNSNLSDVINSDGWQKWNGDNNTENVEFKEFNNTGPGAATDRRVPFSSVRKEAVDITDILGDDYESQWYIDASFL